MIRVHHQVLVDALVEVRVSEEAMGEELEVFSVPRLEDLKQVWE